MKIKVLKPGERLIEKETDYTSGTTGWFGRGVNDAYDLYLVEDMANNLILILFMKIQFIFIRSRTVYWTLPEKEAFVNQFEQAIRGKWGNKRRLRTLSGGKNVLVDFRFHFSIGGWSVTEHWEVHVKKRKKRDFKTSSVNAFTGRVHLDSEDFTPTFKKGGGIQRGVVHEFGHMLGLPDEYNVGTPHSKDIRSIMNAGESIRRRHNSVYIRWLDKVLDKKGIK